MNGYRDYVTSICTALFAALICTIAPRVAHSAFDIRQRSADITQAVEYCEQAARASRQFSSVMTAISSISDDHTILCFDGLISAHADWSAFHQLQENGFLVIRSLGGDTSLAVSIAELLLKKNITVVIRDLCLSACANAIFVASNKTYVLKNSLIAWHGGPSECIDTEIAAALARLHRPCDPFDPTLHFFRTRGISPRHMILPQTIYTRNRVKIILESPIDRRAVFWMWHPKSHRDYFKDRIVYESYPESQEEVNALLRKFRLPIRIVYDPAD
jgi:hypothetical protein